MNKATQHINSFLSKQEQRGREVVEQGKQIAGAVKKGVVDTGGKAALVALGLGKTGTIVAGAGIALGVGAANKTYQVARHPIQTACGIRDTFKDLSQRVARPFKDQLIHAEKELRDSNNTQVQTRLNGIRGISPQQRVAIVAAVQASLDREAEIHKKSVNESALITLPIKSITHRFSIWLAGRAHKRLIRGLEDVKSFADRYHEVYPEQCKGVTDSLITRAKDGKMTLAESVTLKMKIVATTARNKVASACRAVWPDPFTDTGRNAASPTT